MKMARRLYNGNLCCFLENRRWTFAHFMIFAHFLKFHLPRFITVETKIRTKLNILQKGG